MQPPLRPPGDVDGHWGRAALRPALGLQPCRVAFGPRALGELIAGVVMVGDIDAWACPAEAPCAEAGSIAFARPKSNTFTVPSGRTLMFAGLRSR